MKLRLLQRWHPRPLVSYRASRPAAKLLPFTSCLASHSSGSTIETEINTAPRDSQSTRYSASVDCNSPEDARAKRTPRDRSLSLPTVSPPPELQDALKRIFSRYSLKTLTVDGQVLARHLLSRRPPSRVEESQRRKGKLKVVSGSPWNEKPRRDLTETVQTVLRYGNREAMAYAASRLQASYGATLRVFSEIGRRTPSFQPETLLDFGSGLGTAVWAAHQLWGNSLYEYHCVDTSQEMGDLAMSLRAGGEEIDPELNPFAKSKETIPGVHFRQYLSVSSKVQYDIVVAAYTLGDLPSEKLRKLSIASLWKKTKQFLVLIEPGNWVGFTNIVEARGLVLNTSWNSEDATSQDSLNGHVFAPCPHDVSCPLSTDSSMPCHFAQRVQLALSEKNTSLKHSGFHIEKFSYVVLRKGKGPEDQEGKVAQVILTKSKHGELYKQGRRREWGDLLPVHDDKASGMPKSKEPELSDNIIIS